MKEETWAIQKPEDPARIERLAGSFSREAANLQVLDRVSLDRANEIILLGKDIIRAIKLFFLPMKSQAKKAWDGICEAEKVQLAKIEPQVKRLGSEVASHLYKLKLEREALEAKARQLDEERRRIQERALQEAEELEIRARREAARSLKLAEEARQLLGQAQAQEFRDMAIAAAKKADQEITAALDLAAGQEKAIIESKPEIPEAMAVYGQAVRKHWTYEITDSALVPREFCDPSPRKLAEAARIYKDEKKILGVRIFNIPMMVKTR